MAVRPELVEGETVRSGDASKEGWRIPTQPPGHVSCLLLRNLLKHLLYNGQVDQDVIPHLLSG